MVFYEVFKTDMNHVSIFTETFSWKIPNGFAKVEVLVSQSGLTLRAQGL